jgi:DNA-binding CsgD family transcriptional regulator
VVDRAKERSTLLAAASNARAGLVTVVTIEGEAGIGKSWLVRSVVASLTDFTVIQSFTDLPDSPSVLVLDNAQELDAASAATFLTALEGPRLGRLLVIVIGRTGESELVAKLRPSSSREERGAVLTLTGFTTQQTMEFAAEHGIASLEMTRANLLAELTDGNPHHLATAFAELGQRLHVSVPRALPMPESFTAALATTLASLTPGGRALIELLAVVAQPIAITTATEIAARAGFEISFDAAVDSGLVTTFNEMGQRELAIRSVRVAQGVDRSLTPEKRRALHAAVAPSFSGWPRLEHLLFATEHFNDDLATELVGEADKLMAFGQYPDAARMYSRASGVSSASEDREHRIMVAAALAFFSDDAELASTLSASVARCSPSLDREMALGGIGYLLGDFPESLSLVRRALAMYPGPSTDLGMNGHFTAAVIASLELAVVDLAGSITTSSSALARYSAPDGTPPTPAEARLRITSGFALWIASAVDASEIALAPVLALPQTRPELADALTIWAQREYYAGDAASALTMVNLAHEAARASNALHIIPLCIALRSHIEYSLGQWDSAMLDAQAVLAHTTESRNGNHDVLAHSTIAMISANSGHLDEAERHVRVARRLGVERPLPQHAAAAGIAAAVLERESGHPHAVVHALAPLTEGALNVGLTSTGFTGWRAMLAEALIQLGSLERANTVITLFENDRSIRYFGYPGWLRGLLAEAKGDRAAAIAAYRGALATGDESSTPFSHALALRALGTILTGRGEAGESADALKAADRLFSRLGATNHLPAPDESELSLDDSKGWATLTPRERDTALLAAEGLLNREIAASMHVSVKTVEHHLANSLAKLGLRSRRDLEKLAGRGA